MSSVRVDYNNVNLTYTPYISGYDTNYFATTSGSAPTISSGKLRFTSGGSHTKTFERYLDVEFLLTIPTAPTSGHDRTWGLSNPNLGNRGRMEFVIHNTTFSVVCYAYDGTLIGSQAITWVAGWSATETSYRIIWRPSGVRFLIGTVTAGVTSWTCVARFAIGGSFTTPNTKPSYMGMPLHIFNDEADNMDLGAIIQNDIQIHA